MSGNESEIIGALVTAERELRVLLGDSEREIVAIGEGFQELARHIGVVLELAGAIVGCVEEKDVVSVLPRVQTLGSAAKRFIEERLQATAGSLQTVTAEGKLLERFLRLTMGQQSIARETRTLSVLTNIEVARLGQYGSGFKYLAHELSSFSQAVARDTNELEARTDERKAGVEQAKRMLAVEIPRIQEEFAHMENGLENAEAVVAQSLDELSHAPIRFSTSVKEITAQVAGVVAAIQTHDVTRQQMEHVQEALGAIAAKLRDAEGAQAVGEIAQLSLGLTIQIYQLKNIRETVGSWVSQIGLCLDSILRISSSELAGIGQAVLEHEQELSGELAYIERLEQRCQIGSESVQKALAGLSGLMQLVSEHLQRSKSVRNRLQLLSFNSIIEASHLGTQADAILVISQNIKGISAEWSELTEQTGQAMEEILGLVKQAEEETKTTSQGSNEELRIAQAEIRASLGDLREVAGSAADKAMQIESATGKMRDGISETGKAGDRLGACFASIDAVLTRIEKAAHKLDLQYPQVLDFAESSEVERMFSASYTTEMEREVLRAALYGGAVPVAQHSITGNDVELF